MKPLYITEAEAGMLYDLMRSWPQAELCNALAPRVEVILKEFELENHKPIPPGWWALNE